LCLDNDCVEGERENLTQLLARRVDGLVLSYIGGETNVDCLAALEQAGIPIVFFDRYVEGMQAHCVITDNLLGAYRATQTLVDRGFPRVYWLAHTEKSTTVHDRSEGHRRALQARGLYHEDLVVSFPPSTDIVTQRDMAYEATRQLLTRAPAPFAILALNTPILGGAWEALREAGLNHDDFALACFDEFPGQLPEDVLFVDVLQPLQEIGRLAAQMVLEAVAGNREPRRVVLPPAIRCAGGREAEVLVAASEV
jgi:LacI family transcriptional regulator